METVFRSRVEKGLRTVIPKDIVKLYQIEEGDIIEWIYDGARNTRVTVKEVLIKE